MTTRHSINEGQKERKRLGSQDGNDWRDLYEGSSRRGKEWKVQLEGSRGQTEIGKEMEKEMSSWGTIKGSLRIEKRL